MCLALDRETSDHFGKLSDRGFYLQTVTVGAATTMIPIGRSLSLLKGPYSFV